MKGDKAFVDTNILLRANISQFPFHQEAEALITAQLVTLELLDLLNHYPTGGKQVHDTNIVATMLVYEIDTLLTMNFDDFKRFSDIITIIPLQS